jgi:hypothetical protein
MISLNVNLNEKVRVRLTGFGREILEKENIIVYPHMKHPGNWIEFQLWVLMNVFGKCMFNRMMEVPFEDNEIRLVIDHDK